MSQLKSMYSSITTDDFPDTMKIVLGSEELIYEKCSWDINGERKGLRYGENPDQPAALYRLRTGTLKAGGLKWRTSDNAIVSAINEKFMIQSGKHPGKINMTDVDNGINILQYLTQKPACVILKHNNPCGAAWASGSAGGIEKALERAFWCDRIAAFGGTVVVNTPLTLQCAEMIASNYFEVVAAPAYDDGVVKILAGRKNLRIFELPALAQLSEMLSSVWLDIKSLSDGGLIIQKSFQNKILNDSDFQPAVARTSDGKDVVARYPNPEELEDLRFAWAVEAGVTSNSVIFVHNGATVAIGTGEQDRVGCVEIAIKKAYDKYADALSFKRFKMSLYELKAKSASNNSLKEGIEIILQETQEKFGGLAGSRMVSDGFFPFRDGVDAAIAQKVTAIAQPGGSLRDWESIMACNEAVPQVAMVYTAQRSFRH